MRSFAGAQIGRLYADWFTSASSADTEIRGSYRKLIDRSRSLERDNDYQRGFLLSAQRNINGSMRMDLRMDCGEYGPAQGGKPPIFVPDLQANRLIEEAWQEWGKRENCTTNRRMNWRGVRRMLVRSTIRDGNFLVRKLRGTEAGNKFGFRLQIWEIDHLVLEKTGTTQTGGDIRFGIEFDAMQAPIAYWVRARHPGDYIGSFSAQAGYKEVRIPVDEIYHVFIGDRSEQSLGYPWIVSAITRLRQLGAFEEAATIAARLGASKAAYFKKGDPTSPVGEWSGQRDAAGRPMTDVQPGTIEDLPVGWDVGTINWQYPNIETGDFRKAMLRGVATSLGSSYTSIGNDLESVNFSSARVGLFDEREGWKDLQLFFDEEFNELVFSDWLEAAIMNGALNLPLGKFTKFNRPVFKSRRWAMIDPQKEVQALKTAIALRVSSRRGFVAEQGGDIEDIFHDNKDDENLAEKLDLSLQPPDPEPVTKFTGTEAATPGDGADTPPPPGKKPFPSA